jgi:hypothetical protein
MDQSPLVIDEKNAGAELVRRLNETVPVAAAFWLKEDEEAPWYLYIASAQIDDETKRSGYGEVLRIAEEMTNADFDPFRVKLVSADDPLAEAACDILRRLPANRPMRLGAQPFGGRFIEGGFLYPASITSRVEWA